MALPWVSARAEIASKTAGIRCAATASGGFSWGDDDREKAGFCYLLLYTAFPLESRLFLFSLLNIFNYCWKKRFVIRNCAVIAHIEYWRVPILVYRHYALGFFHACDILYRP